MTHCNILRFSSTLEELSVRSNLALAQKKLLVDMEESGDHVDLDKEYLTLSAQVVSDAEETSGRTSDYILLH